ncbi:hypothetical protein [Frankia sp. CcWB2]
MRLGGGGAAGLPERLAAGGAAAGMGGGGAGGPGREAEGRRTAPRPWPEPGWAEPGWLEPDWAGVSVFGGVDRFDDSGVSAAAGRAGAGGTDRCPPPTDRAGEAPPKGGTDVGGIRPVPCRGAATALPGFPGFPRFPGFSGFSVFVVLCGLPARSAPLRPAGPALAARPPWEEVGFDARADVAAAFLPAPGRGAVFSVVPPLCPVRGTPVSGLAAASPFVDRASDA